MKKRDTKLTKSVAYWRKPLSRPKKHFPSAGKGWTLMKLPKLSGLLPEEQWFVEHNPTEAAGHHLHTADWQTRIPGTHRNPAPRSWREEWIKKHSQYDVLICNPRLIQTGSDLNSFSTIIFYKIDYALYTLWQALRRVGRLGQTKKVKALFVVYADTLEANALALLGKKCGQRSSYTAMESGTGLSYRKAMTC